MHRPAVGPNGKIARRMTSLSQFPNAGQKAAPMMLIFKQKLGYTAVSYVKCFSFSRCDGRHCRKFKALGLQRHTI
jgi:hypothetical protein